MPTGLDNLLAIFFFVVGCVPILVASWGFMHFATTDPRRLQSEEHVEQMELIARMGENTSMGGAEIVLSSSSPTVNNPQIGSQEEEL